MSAASNAVEFEGVGGQPVSAQTICCIMHQIGLHGCHPRKKPLLKMMHKKACKQFAENKQAKDMDHWNHVLWSDETCEILKQSMIPSLQKLGRRAVFQHDNDPKHTSKTTTALLKKLRGKGDGLAKHVSRPKPYRAGVLKLFSVGATSTFLSVVVSL